MIKTLVLLSFVGLSSARWYNGYHLVADEEVPLQDSTSDFEVDEELATKLQDDEQSLDDDAYSEPEEECDYTLMRGGFGELKYVTDEQQHFFDYKLFGLSSVANDLGPLKALSYRVQTVAGKNILFKAATEEGQFVHLQFFLPIGGRGDPQMTMMHYATEEACLIPLF